MNARSTMGGRALAAEPLEADPNFALMERNGITRVRVDHYQVDGYRYTNLADALAQVGRAALGRARP